MLHRSQSMLVQSYTQETSTHPDLVMDSLQPIFVQRAFNKLDMSRMDRSQDMSQSKIQQQSEMTGLPSSLSVLKNLGLPIFCYSLTLSDSHREALETVHSWDNIEEEIMQSYESHHMKLSYKNRANRIESYKFNKHFDSECDSLQSSSRFKMRIALVMVIIGIIICFINFINIEENYKKNLKKTVRIDLKNKMKESDKRYKRQKSQKGIQNL